MGRFQRDALPCGKWGGSLGDVDSLYLYLRDRSVPAPAKLRRLAAFCAPHPLSTRHEVFRWSDPRPAWFELKAYLQALRG